jgi:hypothetical protein
MQGTLQKYFETFTSDAHGQVFLITPMDVTPYSQVNVAFTTTTGAASKMMVNCEMGLISGQTVAATVSQFPLGGPAKIYSFPVVGPEFAVVLTGGQPNAQVAVQGWVYLR